jgi:hypothetical protein
VNFQPFAIAEVAAIGPVTSASSVLPSAIEPNVTPTDAKSAVADVTAIPVVITAEKTASAIMREMGADEMN